MEIIVFLAILAIAFFLIFRSRGREFQPPSVSPISQDSLPNFEAAPSLWVNQAESVFYDILLRQLSPGFRLHGKVRLEDIIRVKRDVHPKLRWSLRGRVKSRHIDYLITDKTGRPIIAIELDGSSHNASNPSEADKIKTALFASAGLNLKRVRVGQDFDKIVGKIVSELSAF